MIVVCSIPYTLVGQETAKDSKKVAASDIFQPAQLQTRILILETLPAREKYNLLNELGYASKGTISVSPVPNQIIVRTPEQKSNEIAELVDRLEQSAREQVQLRRSVEKVHLHLDVPVGSSLKWVGGRGGITRGISGSVNNFNAGGSNTFRLTDVPGFERMVVEVRVDISEIDAETAAAMSANLKLLLASPSDLKDLAKGVVIRKFITGPHDLTSDQTELFDEVVMRGDETLLEGSPETKGKGIVAVVHLTGVLSNSAAAGNTDPLVAQQMRQPSKLAGGIQSKASADSILAPSDVIDVSSKFTAAEDQVTELTKKLGKLSGTDTEVDRDLRKQLPEAVTAAFKMRQQLHQTQIDVQRAKLDALERRVAQRSETAQQIINQRVAKVLKAAGISAGAENAKSANSGDKRLDGNVSIDYESETDIVTVRGNKTDVERTLNVIEKIKQQSTTGAGKR